MALSCYRCGASLSELSLPLRRLDECPECSVELHVCRMCVNFAPDLPKGCAEDDALEVRDKSSANFCDYFKPSEWAYRPGADEAEAAAKAELRALFGEGGAAATEDAGQAQASAEPGAGTGTGDVRPEDRNAPQAGGSEEPASDSGKKSPEQRALEQARSLFRK